MKINFAIFLLFAWGCLPAQKKESPNPSVESSTLDAKTFKEKLSSESGAVLLDVRTPQEVAEGMIPGAVVMDFNAPDFTDKISALDKDKSYFVYCKVGGRSGKTVDQMKAAGFKKLYNLKGGYSAWVENGFEVEIPKR